MQYSFKKINIESPFPTTQCGHSSQVNELFDYHDHLYARVVSFKDEDNWIFHYSMDLLAFDLEHRNELETYLKDYFKDDSIHVITSTTHTHYANSVRNPDYVAYLCELLKKETINMTFKEVDNITTSYQKVHTTAVGKSRISGYETNNEYLALIRFYSNDNNFLNIIYYNCHPTILQANVPYFSSEYPGYVLKKLEDNYPNVDFTYIQGAAGDISSRFVRSSQDYDSVIELGDRLYEEIMNLYNQDVSKQPLSLKYKQILVDYEHEFTPVDLSKIRDNLSDRELETIKLGQQQREKLEKNSNTIFSKLVKKALISTLYLGSVQLIFFPNEIFSEYINYIDMDSQLLVSYSNGYGPYVLPLDFNHITYEMFTDTLTRKTKEKIIEIFKTI